MNKKGDQILMENVIFIILNAIFFLALFYFVAKSSTGASVYEETYAKKIALIIDEAKPGTSISIKIDKLLEIAERNNVNTKDIFEIKENKVYVNLGLGYSFAYFSDYNVRYSINGLTNKLDVEIKEK